VIEAKDNISAEEVDAALSSSREESSAENVAAGLDDARATLAEIWRNTPDSKHRARVKRALGAVITAEHTMKCAERFLLAPGGRARTEAFDRLRIACVLRIGHDVRRKP